MVVEAHVGSVWHLSSASAPYLPRVPPVTFYPDFRTQKLTLHKTTTLKTAGPNLPDETAHSQSHDHTVAGGGWDLLSGTKVTHPSTATNTASGHITSTLQVKEKKNILSFWKVTCTCTNPSKIWAAYQTWRCPLVFFSLTNRKLCLDCLLVGNTFCVFSVRSFKMCWMYFLPNETFAMVIF